MFRMWNYYINMDNPLHKDPAVSGEGYDRPAPISGEIVFQLRTYDSQIAIKSCMS